MITQDDIRRMVFTRCEQAGGIRKFAAERKINPSLLSMTLAGHRDVSTTIAATVGYMPVTRFEPIKRVAQ